MARRNAETNAEEVYFTNEWNRANLTNKKTYAKTIPVPFFLAVPYNYIKGFHTYNWKERLFIDPIPLISSTHDTLDYEYGSINRKFSEADKRSKNGFGQFIHSILICLVIIMIMKMPWLETPGVEAMGGGYEVLTGFLCIIGVGGVIYWLNKRAERIIRESQMGYVTSKQ